MKSTKNSNNIVDLTHPIKEKMTVWPGDPETEIIKLTDIADHDYNLNRLSIGEHTGTHIGSPSHFNPVGQTMDQIDPRHLVINASKINITDQCRNNPDYRLSLKDIQDWEKKNGPITLNSTVLVETGWSRLWNEPNSYFGLENNGKHFPGISLEAAEFLCLKRQIKGMGIDTAGIDGSTDNFPVNSYICSQNIYHLENLNNLHLLPATGILLMIGALAIKKGHGSPCRIFAIVA